MKRILSLLGAALFAVAFTAPAQVTPVTHKAALTNSTVLWLTNSFYVLATNRQNIEIQQGKGLSITAVMGGTSEVTTGLVCLRFSVSADGTNWSNNTNNMLCAWAEPYGAAPSIIYTNWSSDLVDNARYIRLWDVTNYNTGVTCSVYRITNCIFTQRN